jgi:GTP cyclohydrolase-4
MIYPDVQNERPKYAYKLTRVGVSDVKKQIFVKRPNKNVTLTVTIDLYVDLPATKKGADMSRNVEILSEIVEESIKSPCSSLENLSEEIVKRMLKRHEYATYAEVTMSADYFLEKSTYSGRKTVEQYTLLAKANIDKDKNIRKMAGVKVVGITVCPCAMETTRAMLIEQYPEYEEFLNKIPVISHNQRNDTTLLIEVPGGFEVEADDLIELVENSMSAPTREILKRKDEGLIVLNSHLNPKFVEDVVRTVLTKVEEKYKGFPSDTLIQVKSLSEESIHKHNAFAEVVTTLQDLKNQN